MSVVLNGGGVIGIIWTPCNRLWLNVICHPTLHFVPQRFYFCLYQSYIILVTMNFKLNFILFLRNEVKYNLELIMICSLYLKHSLQLWKLKILHIMEHLSMFSSFFLGFSFLWFIFMIFKGPARTQFFTMFFQIVSLYCFPKKENKLFWAELKAYFPIA